MESNREAEGEVGSNDGDNNMPELQPFVEPDPDEENEVDEEVAEEEDDDDDDDGGHGPPLVQPVEPTKGEALEETDEIERDDDEAEPGSAEEVQAEAEGKTAEIIVENTENGPEEEEEEEEEEYTNEGNPAQIRLSTADDSNDDDQIEEGVDDEDSNENDANGKPSLKSKMGADREPRLIHPMGIRTRTTEKAEAATSDKEASIMTRKRSASLSSSDDGPKRKQGRSTSEEHSHETEFNRDYLRKPELSIPALFQKRLSPPQCYVKLHDIVKHRVVLQLGSKARSPDITQKQRKRKSRPPKKLVQSKIRKRHPLASDRYTKEEVQKYKKLYCKNSHCPYCITDFDSPACLARHLRIGCSKLPSTAKSRNIHNLLYKNRLICTLRGKGVSLRSLDTFVKQLQRPPGTYLASSDMLMFWNNDKDHPRKKSLRLTDRVDKYSTKKIHAKQIMEIKAGILAGTINRVIFPVTFFTFRKGGRAILPQLFNKEHAALLVVERCETDNRFHASYFDSVAKTDIFQKKVRGGTLRLKLKNIFSQNITVPPASIYFSLTPNACAAVVAHWIYVALATGSVQHPEGYKVIEGIKLFLQDSLQRGRKRMTTANTK